MLALGLDRQDVDWQGFLRISQTDPLVGTKMWNIFILTYQINTSSEIILHGKRLRTPQDEGHKIQEGWKEALIAAQYLQTAERPTSLVDLGDIVKACTLDIHRTWTCDIRSGRTSEIEMHALIYSKGTHIESKKYNDDILPKSEGTGLPATNDFASQDRLLQEQLALLTAAGTQGGGRRFYKGRGCGREGT